jgi:hypothetical protein
MLMRVCSIKNSKPQKMPKGDYLAHRKALNEKRKKAMHTHG